VQKPVLGYAVLGCISRIEASELSTGGSGCVEGNWA
jgi:hypothetical protein